MLLIYIFFVIYFCLSFVLVKQWIPSTPEERVKRNYSALSGQTPVEQKPVEDKKVKRKMALNF
jgi:hypothetical protein